MENKLLHLILSCVPLVPESSHMSSHVVAAIIIKTPVFSLVWSTVLLLKSSSILFNNPVIICLG